MLVTFKNKAKIQRIGNAAVWSVALRLLAVGAFLFSAYMTFRYIRQPLVDILAFRQTQTALTSYWMLKEGWMLAYQTPVAGFPWSIPFEFPIYQSIVAGITAITGFDLGAVGRFVSFAFLIACAWPAFTISRRLALSRSVPWVFCALLWTSPLNVYWGRTFMIETAATFFTFACMPYAIDLIRRVGGWRSVALFIVFASAGVLQKATTGAPVLLFLLLAVVVLYMRQTGISVQTLQRLVFPIAVLCIPLAIGLAWTHYTDLVKMENPFGSQLTSKKLFLWNFGWLSQRLHFETWRLVFWKRSIVQNAGGILGMLLLALPWVVGHKHRRFAWLSLGALVLFMLPVLIFTNLHFVHEYYQVACVIFLIAALSIVMGGWLSTISGQMLVVPVVTLIFMLMNITAFNSLYGIVTARSLNEQDPDSVKAYKIGRYLREHTPPNSGLVIFGQDWSSEIAFQSQRKAMTAPPWFREYKKLWKNPKAYLGPLPLGAIVVCPPRSKDGFPNATDVLERLSNEPGWHLVRMDDCQILLQNSVP